jgi:ATP-binding cassette, subfamily B, multidrug efflux pump
MTISGLEDYTRPRMKQRIVFMRLVRYMNAHVSVLVWSFALLIGATASNVVGPILIKTFIDKYLTPHHFPAGPLYWLGTTYIVLQCTSACLNFFQMVSFQKVALRIVHQMRLDVFAKVQQLGLAFFDKTPGGMLISRITNDTEAVKDLFVSVLSTFVQNIFLLGGILISMFVLDVRLAAYCLLLIPVLIAMMTVYSHFSSRIFHMARSKLSFLNAKLNESLQGMYLIQAMRQEKRLRQEFDGINQQYKAARMRNINLNGLLLRPLVDMVYLCALILILSFFGIQSFHSAVDIGVLYAFVNYLEQFFEPVNQMMQRLNLFQQSIVSAERVFELLDQTEMAPTQIGSGNPTIQIGQIRFDNVSFSYDGKTRVLEDINFTAEPGQTVALVGHTGSGKTSIINLLMRFYPIEQGTIYIDGVPLNAYTDEELRSRVGLVLQDPFIFVGDVKSNIRLGRTHISDDAVIEAAQFVQADPFIRKLPHQYDEEIGERGATFSSGQRQLLSFARTMADEPKVLVLDEATASIDTETEELIQESLHRMRFGRTTIAIAHRLSTIQDADLILVLHYGRIVERGTHQELLAHGGLYHKMYLLQQGGAAVV